MPQERLRNFLNEGVSVFVATVDADGVPTCCRGVALTSKDDFDTVTVYVPAATGQETVANVATTRRVAIGCSRPLTHDSVQIKGLTRGVRLAPPSDEAFVRERLSQFADVLGATGVPTHLIRSMAHWPAFAIDVSVEQVFDQTPGPKAGNAIG
ncbi:MAG: pyridoxamine 5'-phosphate oxidase family protein [Acidobacteriota bacterium]|nr:pyridoxamine 5'-phosphate oxidase family protein [Acidobacteriota bacterium]